MYMRWVIKIQNTNEHTHSLSLLTLHDYFKCFCSPFFNPNFHCIPIFHLHIRMSNPSLLLHTCTDTQTELKILTPIISLLRLFLPESQVHSLFYLYLTCHPRLVVFPSWFVLPLRLTSFFSKFQSPNTLQSLNIFSRFTNFGLLVLYFTFVAFCQYLWKLVSASAILGKMIEL